MNIVLKLLKLLKLVAPFALSYWREVTMVLLVGIAIASCHARDRAIEARGAAEGRAHLADSLRHVQLRAADSTNQVLADSLKRVAAAIDRSTAVITRWLTRTDTVEHWRHDTTYVNGVPSFTVPVARIDDDDAGKAACRDLTFNCADFRRFAAEKFHTDSNTIRTLRSSPPVTIQTSCKETGVFGALIGAAIGGTAGYALHR